MSYNVGSTALSVGKGTKRFHVVTVSMCYNEGLTVLSVGKGSERFHMGLLYYARMSGSRVLSVGKGTERFHVVTVRMCYNEGLTRAQNTWVYYVTVITCYCNSAVSCVLMMH